MQSFQEKQNELQLLEHAGILTQSNKAEMTAFLGKDSQYADKLALALIELQPAKSLIQENMQEIKDFLINHAEYAHIYAGMLKKLYGNFSSGQYGQLASMREFLSEDYKKEIETSVVENAGHAVSLALAKIQLKSESAEVKNCVQVDYLIQHPEHAYELVLAVRELSFYGFLKCAYNFAGIIRFLVELGENADIFARGITILCECKHLDSSDTEFLNSKYVLLLKQCPPQYVRAFARGVSELINANICDEEHIELLLDRASFSGSLGTALCLLKQADQNNSPTKENLFNQANKRRLVEHAHQSSYLVMEAIIRSIKLVLDEHNFNNVLKYGKYSFPLRNFIIDGADQAALDQYLAEIDHQIKLQKLPFLICVDKQTKVDPNKGLGLFSRFERTLCEKIFSFLPSPKPPKGFEFKR